VASHNYGEIYPFTTPISQLRPKCGEVTSMGYGSWKVAGLNAHGPHLRLDHELFNIFVGIK